MIKTEKEEYAYVIKGPQDLGVFEFIVKPWLALDDEDAEVFSDENFNITEISSFSSYFDDDKINVWTTVRILCTKIANFRRDETMAGMIKALQVLGYDMSVIFPLLSRAIDHAPRNMSDNELINSTVAIVLDINSKSVALYDEFSRIYPDYDSDCVRLSEHKTLLNSLLSRIRPSIFGFINITDEALERFDSLLNVIGHSLGLVDGVRFNTNPNSHNCFAFGLEK